MNSGGGKQHIKCTTLNPHPATFIHCIEIEPCRQQVALPNCWDSLINPAAHIARI